MRALNYTSLLLLLCISAKAQMKWDWGCWAGGANYLGDLVEHNYPVAAETNLAGGAFLSYYPGYRWSFRMGASFANISGSDANFKNDPIFIENRNLKFRTQITEGALSLVWEPWGKKRYPVQGGLRRIVSPYLFAGVGWIRTDRVTDYSDAPRAGLFEAIQKDATAVSLAQIMSFPLGGGLKIDVGKSSSIGFELGLRKTNTDFLDGVSFSGNPNKDDWYVFGGFSFSKRFKNRDFDQDGIVDQEDACPRLAGVASAKGCPDIDGDGIEDLEDSCPEQAGLRDLGGCPDTDGDGVADKEDECPGEQGILATKGCPDRDGDLIPDKEDRCPDIAGLGILAGCPDTDSDGIADMDDNCPDIFGIAQLKGCPFVDSDGDGIRDEEDACPETAGLDSLQGCPFKDTDKDGIPDETDECPEVAGLTALKGCPDRDGDGIPDHKDRCPDSAGKVSDKGCPVLTQEVRKILNLAARAVQFETASAVLKPESLKELDQVVEILKTYSHYTLRIEGHTDSRGAAKVNLLLSTKRAKTCYIYLKNNGIDTKRMTYKGWGESKPIRTNKTEAGRQRNRRVEFILK